MPGRHFVPRVARCRVLHGSPGKLDARAGAGACSAHRPAQANPAGPAAKKATKKKKKRKKKKKKGGSATPSSTCRRPK
eukprot:9691938-Alexandrium_andersonii.AAC.1